MDTKQKNRSGQVRRESAAGSTGRKPGSTGAQQRSSATRSNRSGQTGRSVPGNQKTRGAQQTRRAPERNPQRSAQPIQRTAQETHNMVQQNAYAPHKMEEQVFKTEQKKQRVMNPEAVKRAEQRKKSALRTKQRKAEAAKKKKRPQVTYTQPVPVNLNQMLMKILIVVAVVVAFTLGISVFFKVEKVVVYGNKAYSAWTVQEAGGVETGTNLLSLNNTRACGKIMAALPYVDNVRIGIKLPDTVNIYVEEIDVAYAVQTQDGTNWLMTSGGKVVEQIDSGVAKGYTLIEGVYLDSPAPGQQARALETLQENTGETTPDALGETVPVVITGAARLDTALMILRELEANDIVGEAASIDVSILNNIELWYGQRFQVKLGDSANMGIKISWMKSAINQRSDYEMGILDVSFTTWPDRVGYTPFSD